MQSQPSDLILQSFNAFNSKIAGAPNNIFGYLNNYRIGQLAPADLNFVTNQQQFRTTRNEYKNSEETKTGFAASVGLTGSYGFFSGSVQASHSRESYASYTGYNFGFNAFVNPGSLSFYRPNGVAAIKAYLVPELLTALNGIGNLQQAADFTERYGTHLITGVNLGGALYIGVIANTADESSKMSTSAEVQAEYSAVSSMSAAAKATATLDTKFQSESYQSTIHTIGGSIQAAAKLNVADPNTFSEWAATCTAESVLGISNTIELWELAEATSPAGNFLKLFVQLKVVMQSINYPSYFANTIAILPYQENRVVASADDDFKIISGGAAVTANSSSFLTGCYPNLDQDNNVTGWVALSHDITNPANPATDAITAYAIALYDPTNLLKISCTSAAGSNPGKGADSARAQVAPNSSLTGGGATGAWSGGREKFLMQSFPDTKNSWTGMIHDYEYAAENVPLTVYAIGISSEYLTILPQITQGTIHDVQHGNAIATAKNSIAGGGVKVELVSGDGNLAQQSFPSSPTTWAAYNKDTDGNVSPANSTAFAIQLQATLNS